MLGMFGILYIVIYPSITWIFSSFLGQSSGSEPFMSWYWLWLQWLLLRIVVFSIFSWNVVGRSRIKVMSNKESLLFILATLRARLASPRLENTNLSWEIVVDQKFHILWGVGVLCLTDQTGLFQGWQLHLNSGKRSKTSLQTLQCKE